MLSDKQIRGAIEDGRIVVDPAPTPLQFDSCSLDLRFGGGAKVWKQHPKGAELTFVAGRFNYAESADQYLEDVLVEDGRVVIKPGRFLLALTHEKIFLKPESKIMAWVQGKSSLARMGLQVHLTAPTIHVGFKGQITLELLNSGRCALALEVEKTPVCQLIFQEVGDVAERQQGTFHGQGSVTG